MDKNKEKPVSLTEDEWTFITIALLDLKERADKLESLSTHITRAKYQTINDCTAIYNKIREQLNKEE